MKAKVYTINGEWKEIELPPHFEEEVRPDLIRRAVIAIWTHRFQPKGVRPKAGRDYTAEYIGRRDDPRCAMTRGLNRLPRTKHIDNDPVRGFVANVPQAVGGPVAHPPKVEKKIYEKINKKERRKAIRSAIAATAVKELILERHKIPEDIELPIIIDKEYEKISKTKEVRELLKKLRIWEDIEYAMSKKRVRAGKGKRRGRKYKRKKSILFVVSGKCPLIKAVKNLEGVDVVSVDKLNAEVLAPGGQPGRLTVWTEGAIEKLYNLFTG
jgi:large subunit ribosomal protein L4e